MKKGKLTILLVLILVLSLFCGCNNQNNSKSSDGDVYLLYEHREIQNDDATGELQGKDTIEYIVLLKINKDDEKHLYGITGDQSKEYENKLYYDVFKVKNENDEIFIYYHILVDNTLDMSNFTMCKQDFETDKLTKYSLPKEVYGNIDDLGLNYIDINGSNIIYMNKSMERILKYKEKEEREIWFHFIPLNCRYCDIDIRGFELSLNDATNRCDIDGVLIPSDIEELNTGKPNISYSPLNITIRGTITIKDDKISPQEIIDKSILKYNSQIIN